MEACTSHGMMSPAQLKAMGNDLYREGRHAEAVQVFTTLIKAAKASFALYGRPSQAIGELLSLLHANRAAAFLKMGKHIEVMADCKSALYFTTDPCGPTAFRRRGGAFGCPCPISEGARRTTIKVLGRRSAAREAIDDLAAAIVDLQHVLLLDYEDEYEVSGRYKKLLGEWKKREKAKEIAAHRAMPPKAHDSANLYICADGLVEEVIPHSRRKRCAQCRRAKEKGRLTLRMCPCKKVYYCSLYCQKTHWRSTHGPECKSSSTFHSSGDT